MGLHGRNITIIGAGIGGLTAALSLRRHGAAVTVLEQSDAISEVGAGLQISPNGAVVLRALGLGQALGEAGMRARAVVLRDYKTPGEVLRLDLAGLTPEQRYYFVHRSDLIDMLADAARAAGVRIRLLQKVTQVAPGARPSVTLANGAQLQSDLIVGADGVHSRARVALCGPDAAQFTGQVAWRAVVPNDLDLPPEAVVHMGPGRHLVCYPLRGGAMVNLVAVEERAAWAEEGWNHRDDPANLVAAFAGFSGVAKALIHRVNAVRLWGLFRHPVAETWHAEGVGLLGDAAHPTLPFLAQGANMAIEDAWVLADCLSQTQDTQLALAQYQDRRRARVVRVIRAANSNAWKYHLRLPPVRGAAHLALRLGGAVAPGAMVRQFDWLYGHDVTAR